MVKGKLGQAIKHYKIGRDFEARGHLDMAIKEYNRSLQYLGYEKTLFALGNIYLRAKNPTKALVFLERGLRSRPQSTKFQEAVKEAKESEAAMGSPPPKPEKVHRRRRGTYVQDAIRVSHRYPWIVGHRGAANWVDPIPKPRKVVKKRKPRSGLKTRSRY